MKPQLEKSEPPQDIANQMIMFGPQSKPFSLRKDVSSCGPEPEIE